MKVSPIGQPIVFAIAILSGLAFLLGSNLIGVLFAVCFAAAMFAFRSPENGMKCCSSDMIAPIGGRIVEFSEYYVDQKLHWRWQRIDIRRNLLGPWTLFSPLEGQIVDAWFQDNPEHGRLELVIQLRSSVQEDFLLILVANSFLNYFDSSCLQPGTILGKGGNLGFCTLSRVSICVPASWVFSATFEKPIQARRNILFHVGN